ncbi:MAG TPA: hypothetical protein VFG86_08215, partial [Chloroflexota bacterium]|nr:hypothetical protein [Chloroflexota bacterium]
MNSQSSAFSRAIAWRPTLSSDALVLLASLFFALSANGPFWRGVLDGRVFADAATWRFAAGVAVMLLAVHVLIVAPFAHRWVVKP